MTDAQTERKERKRGLTGHDSERNIKRKKCWKEKRDALQTKKIVFIIKHLPFGTGKLDIWLRSRHCQF